MSLLSLTAITIAYELSNHYEDNDAGKFQAMLCQDHGLLPVTFPW